jgi:hypothetical protein
MITRSFGAGTSLTEIHSIIVWRFRQSDIFDLCETDASDVENHFVALDSGGPRFDATILPTPAPPSMLPEDFALVQNTMLGMVMCDFPHTGLLGVFARFTPIGFALTLFGGDQP